MAVLAVALSASACSGAGAEPAPPRAVTPTAVPTSSGATPSPVVDGPAGDPAAVPRAARAHTFAGAQAFAEFYLAQLNKAWQTPDPSVLVPYSSDTCLSCKNLVDTATSLRTSGQRYETDAFKRDGSAWLPGSRPNAVTISVVVQVLPARIVDSSGNVVETVTAERGSLRFDVDWLVNRWVVRSVKQEVLR